MAGSFPAGSPELAVSRTEGRKPVADPPLSGIMAPPFPFQARPGAGQLPTPELMLFLVGFL